MSLQINKVSEAIWITSGLNNKIAASVQNNSRYSVPSRNDKHFSDYSVQQKYMACNLMAGNEVKN